MYPRQMRMNPRRGGFNVRGPPPGRGGLNNPIFPPGRGGFDTFIPPGRGGFINQPFPGRGGFNNQPFPGRGGFGPQMYPMRGGFNQEYSRPGNRRGGRSNHMHPGRGGLGNYPGGWDDRFHNRRNNQGKGLMHKQRGNLHQKPKKSVYRHQDQLSENEVGITEYINDLEGFTGIIKARYSDFHVNEINVDGTVAKLTSTNPPTDFGSNVDKKDYKDTEESPLELIPQESWEKMKELVTSENGEPIDLDTENMTKQERTKVHQCVKTYFGQKIVASTITTGEKKYIQFKKYNKEEKIDRRFEWPDDKGEYVHFLVYKESLDTMDACLKISDCVNMSPANFTYGGVKDKRAKTTQWFCVKRVNPWKLMKRTRPLKNVRLGNYEFKDAPLKLGHLQGNRFKIALRNVTGSDELINQSMQSIKEKGFINYYGLQRFGNDKEVPTYEIGVNLLLGKWKEATQLILKPKTSDDPSEDVSKAKKIYSETGDAAKAFSVLQATKNKSVEARLLQGLKKTSANEFVNALETIPRNMRLLYIHSFQSLIWNKMVSKRLHLFGMQPVEGDFVLVETNEEDESEEIMEADKDDEGTKDEIVINEEQDEIDSDKKDEASVCEDKQNETDKDQENDDNEIINNKDDNKEDNESDNKDREKSRQKRIMEIPDLKPEDIDEKLEEEALKCKQKVKALQKEDLQNYTIYDIVLPLPGYDINYPEILKDCYKEALEEYGLTLEMTRQRVKTYTLSGNYRKIMERAHDMSWKIMRYNNPVDTLIRSDLEELKGAKEPKDVKDGKYKALIMEFNLPSSSYATMVLREILKMDTSSSSHALMNDYHQSNVTKKIIISDHEENPSENADGSDSTQASSLLSDSEKYEEFKNTIFQTIEGTTKRKNEEEVEEDGSGKKIKTEDVEDKEQTGIKMEASVV